MEEFTKQLSLSISPKGRADLSKVSEKAADDSMPWSSLGIVRSDGRAFQGVREAVKGLQRAVLLLSRRG